MTEAQTKTQGKIRAAKHWLSRAETHFERNAPIRGEMELLIAQAELRSTREDLKTRPGTLRTSWIQQAAALVLAALFLAVGAGTLWFRQEERSAAAPQPASLPVSAVLPVRPEPIRKQSLLAAPVRTAEASPAVAADSTVSGQEVKNADKSSPAEPLVSEDHMRRLVQTAGQSLRGRSRP